MSQKKVDKYKNNKFGRSSAQKKERVEFVLEMAAWILIAALFVGWIGYSAYAKIRQRRQITDICLTTVTEIAKNEEISRMYK